jgi:hypothetical protein
MAVIVELAEAVKDVLNRGVFSRDFVAERAYRPQMDAEDIEGTVVTVVAANRRQKPQDSTRGGKRYDYTIDVGIQTRYQAESLSDRDEAMDFVEEVEDYLTGSEVAADMRNTHGAHLVGAENDPLYVPEHMGRRLFTSVISVTFAIRR